MQIPCEVPEGSSEDSCRVPAPETSRTSHKVSAPEPSGTAQNPPETLVQILGEVLEGFGAGTW